jgi:hypothetical protein
MWLWWTAGAVGGVLLTALGYRWLRQMLREVHIEKACELFQLEREHLEAKFLEVAAGSGKPRGLRWAAIDWGDEVLFLRDRTTGSLSALVGITVHFEAIDGQGMEDNPNVSCPRDATAVFDFTDQHWVASGRVLFNMDPTLALSHYRDRYEVVRRAP